MIGLIDPGNNILSYALFQNATLGIFVIKNDGTIVLANPFAKKLFGYETLDLLNKPIEILLPENIRPQHFAEMAKYFNDPFFRPMGKGIDMLARKIDGSLFPVEISLTYMEFKNETYAVAFVADISERKKIEEQLRMDEHRIRLLVEHTPAAVAMFDTEMRYIIASKRWAEDYHLDDREIIGHSHYEIFPEIGQEWKELHRRCIVNGEHFKSDEQKFVRANGNIDWIKWELTPWYIKPGEIGGAILFTEVVTKQKETQSALQYLNDHLEKKIQDKTKELAELLEHEKEISELKSRFISTASHEFRTPLTTILSSATLLEMYNKQPVNQKTQKHYNLIRSSVKNLTDILDDFLSLEKLEQGKITVQKELFNLHKYLENTIDEISGILKKGQHIAFSFSGRHEVVQDKKLLKNMLFNLLSNAIKYSGEGSEIGLIADVCDGLATVIVTDKGIGIPEAEQKNIFTSFFRAHNVSNIPGTGLGLNIVRKYSELLGGSVSFNSVPGQGTTFILSLPV